MASGGVAISPIRNTNALPPGYYEKVQGNDRVVTNGLNMSTMTISSPCMFKSAPTTKSCALIKNPHSLCSFKSVSKAFGLKSLSFFRVSAMAVFKVKKLIGLDGQESEFEALDDAYILDSAENEGLELPYLCKAGVCSTCAGLMVFGSVVPG
ncbi:hypothetical protein TEA_022961 [Camellia sinensis var. sinensis]|uniref:2Fe-2S ferredoxin-type domain-containing protein n=1 Tax=Camellia sinensis var. sinensis TaxID=542762 RepID=A0A4V3WM79_CAMSN|nr:hypothetical protein TEA_022961 [Camellia sinensis var. sinensis]